MHFLLFERILNKSCAAMEAEHGKTHDATEIRDLLRKIQDDRLAHVVVMAEQKCDSNPETCTHQNVMRQSLEIGFS